MHIAARLAAFGSGSVLAGSGIAWLYARDVRSCAVPAESALAALTEQEQIWYSDAFVISVPRSSIRSGPGGSVRLTDSFCKAFFRSPPLQLEQALSGALGTRRTPAADIDALELLPGESISEFRVAARGTGEVLFDAYSTFAYTWLATRPAQRTIDAHGSDADAAARGGAEERVELLLGSGLTGAGYKGVPLQRYLLTQVALPFHWLYSRVILRAAAGQLQADSSSGKR